MQKKLQKLLRIQLILMLALLALGWLAGYQSWLSGLAAGSLIAIMTTIMAMVIFRRLPGVVSAKMFYSALVVNEIFKWLLVVVMTVLLMQHVMLAALVVGFIVTYLAYFWLILVD